MGISAKTAFAISTLTVLAGCATAPQNAPMPQTAPTIEQAQRTALPPVPVIERNGPFIVQRAPTYPTQQGTCRRTRMVPVDPPILRWGYRIVNDGFNASAQQGNGEEGCWWVQTKRFVDTDCREKEAEVVVAWDPTKKALCQFTGAISGSMRNLTTGARRAMPTSQYRPY